MTTDRPASTFKVLHQLGPAGDGAYEAGTH